MVQTMRRQRDHNSTRDVPLLLAGGILVFLTAVGTAGGGSNEEVILYATAFGGAALVAFFMWRSPEPAPLAYVVLGSLVGLLVMLLLVDTRWVERLPKRLGPDVMNLVGNLEEYSRDSDHAYLKCRIALDGRHSSEEQ